MSDSDLDILLRKYLNRKKMKNSNFSQVVSLNKMWNTLDPSHISDLISNNIYYESYWVIRPIRKKERFLDFFEKKLKTIKDAVQKGRVTIETKIVHIKGNDEEYFLILKQHVKGVYNESLITVSVKDGLIEKMTIEPLRRRFRVNMVVDTEVNN